MGRHPEYFICSKGEHEKEPQNYFKVCVCVFGESELETAEREGAREAEAGKRGRRRGWRVVKRGSEQGRRRLAREGGRRGV